MAFLLMFSVALLLVGGLAEFLILGLALSLVLGLTGGAVLSLALILVLLNAHLFIRSFALRSDDIFPFHMAVRLLQFLLKMLLYMGIVPCTGRHQQDCIQH